MLSHLVVGVVVKLSDYQNFTIWNNEKWCLSLQRKTRICTLIILFTILRKIIEMEAEKYAENCSDDPVEKHRIFTDYKNGMIDAYVFFFNLYIHKELTFLIGKHI